MKKPLFFAFIGALTFFLAAFFTLSDYGISWDETLHFRRGQAYLYYFLTGQTNYKNLPNINFQGTGGKPANIPIPRRSFYQNDYHNGEFWLNNDVGHPPLNDILATLSNYIFFQKLGVLDDIDSHHLFNILASSLLVFVVVYFATTTFGKLAAMVSFLSLTTYPLFWAESHFNIKDPSEAAFFAGCIWAFWQSLKKGNILWLLASIIFFSLALGTKFNILFLPFILIPYLIIRYWHFHKDLKNLWLKIPKKYLVILVLWPVIAGLILIIFWPFLRQDILVNFFKILNYYRQTGLGTLYQPGNFYLFGFNTFPFQWIVFTTPPVVLFLSGIGIISVLKNWRLQSQVSILWLLWLLIPILRVSLPNMSIYGGIRQIMEFLPAMALLAGLGAWQIAQWAKKYKKILGVKVIQLLLILIFIWPVFILIKMHPNENVYFNFLIGGLKGAYERNFPSWGNSFGNAYKQGIEWLNKNAEKNVKVALIQGTQANAPLIFFRPDLDYDIGHFSGIERQGEYLMELIFNDTGKTFFYRWEYVENFLEPIFELKVDGVTILKIWKNDFEHTKTQYRLVKQPYTGRVEVDQDNHFIRFALEREVLLSQMDISFNPKNGCLPVAESFIETSPNGEFWKIEKDPLSSDQLIGESIIKGNNLRFLFADRKAKFVRIVFTDPNSCHFNDADIRFIELSSGSFK